MQCYLSHYIIPSQAALFYFCNFAKGWLSCVVRETPLSLHAEHHFNRVTLRLWKQSTQEFCIV